MKLAAFGIVGIAGMAMAATLGLVVGLLYSTHDEWPVE